MTNNFEDLMSKKTDIDLFKILTASENEYQVAALEAAKKEFAKRNLSEGQFGIVKQEIEQAEKIKSDKATEPLEMGWKILTFVFPGLIQLMFSGAFRLGGYDRKADEFIRWTLYGFGFYIAIALLIIFAN